MCVGGPTSTWCCLLLLQDDVGVAASLLARHQQHHRQRQRVLAAAAVPELPGGGKWTFWPFALFRFSHGFSLALHPSGRGLLSDSGIVT
jgi:hypothetical protein